MKLLIVAATWAEVKPVEEFLLKLDEEGKLRNHNIEVSISGIGGVATAFHLGRVLPLSEKDMVINAGICGSFKKDIPIGSVLNVTEDCFADVGAEDGEEFLDAFEMRLLDADQFPFTHGVLKNTTAVTSPAIQHLQCVKGISANTVHGNEKSILKIISRYNADVETMEGAAFFYSCLKESIPFIQIRAVSNFVEKRDKTKWNIPLAVKSLNSLLMAYLNEALSI